MSSKHKNSQLYLQFNQFGFKEYTVLCNWVCLDQICIYMILIKYSISILLHLLSPFGCEASDHYFSLSHHQILGHFEFFLLFVASSATKLLIRDHCICIGRCVEAKLPRLWFVSLIVGLRKARTSDKYTGNKWTVDSEWRYVSQSVSLLTK